MLQRNDGLGWATNSGCFGDRRSGTMRHFMDVSIVGCGQMVGSKA